MPLLDYAGTLRAAQNLVPDFRMQAMQDEQFAMQREAMQMRRDAMQQQQQAAQAAKAEEVAFQQAWQQVLSKGGKPEDITILAARFPGRFEGIKPAIDRLDANQKQADTTFAGTLYARLNAGDADGAAALLRRRVEADRAAGIEDPEQEELLQQLESGDEHEIGMARATAGLTLNGLIGNAEFKTLFPSADGGEDATTFQKDYAFIARTYGQDKADLFAMGKFDPLVVGQPGAPVFRESDIRGGTPAPTAQEGGDPASTAAGFQLPFEGASFDQPGQQFGAGRGGRAHDGLDFSGQRGSPVRPVQAGVVVDVGRDARSGNYVKVKHADGRVSSYSHFDDVMVSRGQQVGAGDALGTLGQDGNVRAADGRGVLHFKMRDAKGRVVDPSPFFGGPTPVKSKQQYERLASGAEYVAPDGSVRRKP